MIIVLFYAFKIWDTFLGEGHHVEQSSSDIVVSWFLFAKGVQGCAARSGWHCLNSLWYWSPTESQKVAQTSNIFTFFFYSFGQISGVNKQSSFSFHISSVFCIHEYSGLFCAKLQNRLYPHVWWGDTYKCFIFIILMFLFIFTSTCDEETLIFNIQWTLVSNWTPTKCDEETFMLHSPHHNKKSLIIHWIWETYPNTNILHNWLQNFYFKPHQLQFWMVVWLILIIKYLLRLDRRRTLGI